MSESSSDDERLPRERVTPRSHNSDGNHGVRNSVPNVSLHLENRPPLLHKPGKRSYSRYYNDIDYQDDDQGPSFSWEQRSGLPPRGNECDYPRSKSDDSTICHSAFKPRRDDIRHKIVNPSHYMRYESAYKRDPCFFRKSTIGPKSHGVLNSMPKNPPQLEKRCPLLVKPRKRSYSRYYNDIDYQDDDEGPSVSWKRGRSAPPRRNECEYPGSQYNHSTSRHTAFKPRRDDIKHKIVNPSHYMRYESAYKRDPCFFRKSTIGPKSHGVLNSMPKNPPQLEKRCPLLVKPRKRSYSRYYNDIDHQDDDRGPSFSWERGSGAPPKGNEYYHPRSKCNYSTSRHSAFKPRRDDIKHKIVNPSHYMRYESAYKRDPCFFRKSTIGQKSHRVLNSMPKNPPQVEKRCPLLVKPRKRSYSRNYNDVDCRDVDQGCWHSHDARRGPPQRIHKSISVCSSYDHCAICQRYYKHMEEELRRKSVHSFHDTRDEPSCTRDPPLLRGQKETSSNSSDSNVSDRELSPVQSETYSFYYPQHRNEEEQVPSLLEDSQRNSRLQEIESKIKEMEQAYRKYCENFMMVVRKLTEEDSSLEKPVCSAMKQHLNEMSNRYVKEFEHFIVGYNTSTPDFGEHI